MELVMMPPAIESLLRPSSEHCPWPEEVRTNQALRESVEFRVGLAATLDTIFDSAGIADEGKLVEAYNGLAALLESDSSSKRLILYLPFELLPTRSWQPESGCLAEAISRFIRAYLSGWYDLLSVSDVRANFVDGDVPEVELRARPLHRVVKAAHLAPRLVEKGLLTVADVVRLIEEGGSGSVLAESLADALVILVDLGFLSDEDFRRICSEHGLSHVRERKKDIPAVITDERRRWLEKRERELALGEIINTTCNLVAPFAHKADKLKQEVGVLDGLIAEMEHGEELYHYLYPAIVIFGSRIKGYGTKEADLDYAVFIRPGIKKKERAAIQEFLSQAVPRELKGKAVEFWLEGNGDGLRVRDFSISDRTLADSNWVHVLFGGAWYGDRSAVEELHRRLLVSYLEGAGRRDIWLEELEKDTLQYRLMHSGYDRCFPKQGRIDTEHCAAVDGDAAFFDSGFRRLATKLFIEKVFLPQLGSC